MANAWDNGTNTGAGLWGDNRAARDAAWSSVGLNPSGRYPGFDMGKRGVVGLFPAIGQQVNFANEMEPIREQMIRNFITQNNPNNSNYLVDASRRNALSSAMEGQSQLAANGYGGAFTDMASAMSQGNEAGANAYTQIHSPEGQNALYSNVLGAVGQGQNISLLPAAEAFHGMTLNTPRNQSGLAAVGQVLGQGLGMFAQGMGSGAMGGGGGGALIGSNYNPSFYNDPAGPPDIPKLLGGLSGGWGGFH